jgi:preprotein translocase subunit SecA
MITPTQEYRRIGHRTPAPALKGLDAFANSCVGVYQRRSGHFDKLRADAELIDGQAKEWKDLPASDRQLGLRPFSVQLMGALALHRGFLAEMATGEGKTLTAGLAGVLAGWTKRPCHIVTVNDYLVARDSDWLRALYSFCGVRVGHVIAQMNPTERQKGYGCDVTYTTSKELLADFLRDKLRMSELRHPTRRLIRQMLMPHAAARDGLVLRGLHTAIVDEADSVLIDEAVTPLIISSTHENAILKEAAEMAARLVSDLQRDVDYRLNTRYREIEITDSGKKKLTESCSILPGLWRGSERPFELLKQALVAQEFFLLGKQYIIDKDKVVIVDEFTGRPMAQRTWKQGLHQAIEAKEKVPISDPSETIARLSFQRFFRCFHKLSGMTGTAQEAAGEFWQTYRLPVVRIPTNKPCVRKQFPDQIFTDDASKWAAIVEEVARLHATGQPILVGTRSVTASEHLAQLLTARGLAFKLLNASRLSEEAQIITLAGEKSHITIATNMAGRGTDIKLGHGVAAVGGLHVLATERHESGRVDRQLFGRSARQGDPGSAQAFVSAQDELIRRYLPGPLHGWLVRLMKAGVPPRELMAKKAFNLAQRQAQKQAAKQRRAVLRADSWLEESLSFAGAAEV